MYAEVLPSASKLFQLAGFPSHTHTHLRIILYVVSPSPPIFIVVGLFSSFTLFALAPVLSLP
jgi:hypothetical protein